MTMTIVLSMLAGITVHSCDLSFLAVLPCTCATISDTVSRFFLPKKNLGELGSSIEEENGTTFSEILCPLVQLGYMLKYCLL